MSTTSYRGRLFLAIAMVGCVVGFAPTSIGKGDSKFIWELKDIIEAQTDDSIKLKDEDAGGAGGVKLAQESAIKIVGDIQHKPGNAESFPQDLLRYDNLITVDESMVQNVFNNIGSAILCSGQGVEYYKEPGQTTNKEVDYAPLEAIKDAVTKASSAMESETLVFNFLGGDDLMAGEVLEAGSELVLALDIPTKTKVSFNSLSHKTIPSGTCTVTVASVGAQETDSLSGIEKALAQGEVYTRDGTWYTVQESDINTAVA